MLRKGLMRSLLLLAAALVVLTGCAAETGGPLVADDGGLFATAKGKVTRINRRDSWFEVKPKSGGGPIAVSYDATTTLLNFKEMIEITKDQPVEVTYMPGEPVNRAVTIRKLQPDECS